MGPNYPSTWSRTHHGVLGDAVECYLYALYSEQTNTALDLIADWASLATCLHELLQGVPPAVYYRLD